MNPSDLGLPPKFDAFRQGQFDAALSAATSEKRFTLLSSPTGSGKSLIYMSVAALIEARTLVLTGTKGLQRQLSADFGPMGLIDIRGQPNYRCVAFDTGSLFDKYGHPGDTCDKGPCHVGLQCGFRLAGCEYYDAVRAAAKSRLVVTNYAYWMTSRRYSDPEALGDFDLIILDEAHTAPDELADFCAIEIEADEVRILLKMSMPPHNEGQEIWVEWAEAAYRKCKDVQTIARSAMEDIYSTDRRTTSRYLRRVTNLLRNLDEIRKAHRWRRAEPGIPDITIPGMQTDWIVEETRKGLMFSPVWAHAYAESYLFAGIPKVVLLSATLQPTVARYLGIPADDMEYKEFASTFNPARRPLIYVPTTTVDRNMSEGQVRVWVNKIDRIIDSRLDRKGIIHARSFERANTILARSRHRHLMFPRPADLNRWGRPDNTAAVVDAFDRARAPAILVSPSMETGYDFPGDRCRYQIIAKVPFVDSRSAIVKARAKSDKTYLNYLTSQAIIQMTGRAMRSNDDWCETLIIDDHITWFWQAAKAQKLWPRWFQAAYKKIVGLPPPLTSTFAAIKSRWGPRQP